MVPRTPPERHEVSRMKKQMPPARPKVAPPIPVRHQLEHEVPTVIHHPEEKMTALGRLTFRVLQEPRKYSTWALAVLLGILALVVGMNFSSGGRSRSSEAWTKLETAKKAEQRVDVAKEYPNTLVSTWALLQAATEYHNLALADLPNNADVALSQFKKALELFDQVSREAPTESFQARAALWGKARTLEARNDLPQAIEQYELIVKKWPEAPEAGQAKQMIEALKRPEAASFYKELYTYRPARVTLPPLGSEDLNLPSTGLNLPPASLTAPAQPTPLINMPVELAPPPAGAEKSKLEEANTKASQPATKTDAEKKSPPAKTELPLEVLSPPAGAPKEKAPR
jgi:tetratricopeptide (TPR) repeat protein